MNSIKKYFSYSEVIRKLVRVKNYNGLWNNLVNVENWIEYDSNIEWINLSSVNESKSTGFIKYKNTYRRKIVVKKYENERLLFINYSSLLNGFKVFVRFEEYYDSVYLVAQISLVGLGALKSRNSTGIEYYRLLYLIDGLLEHSI